jgi:hypothetical protein
MSSPLAIGAVSAVLRNLLDNGLVEAGNALGSTVLVSAVAPDTIKLDVPEDPPRLNLFLHQVTPNAGWRNAALPSRSGSSGERLTNAPLALDLHYLVTAYAQIDFQAEILLGYAMHLLHERPVLDRAAVRRALDPSPLDVTMLPPAYQALAASDLADQVELLKITPSAMGIEEMSKLWAAIQSHYRPSAAYQVSVVLIEGTKPSRSPLPVLSRGKVDPTSKRDRGVVVVPDLLPALPTLLGVEYAARQTSARLGETLTVKGIRLAGTGARARFAHRLLATPIERPVTVTAAADGERFSLVLPSDAAAQAGWPPGLWRVSLVLTPAGDIEERETNALPVLLSPEPVIVADGVLGLPPISLARSALPPQVSVVLSARPQVRPEQAATLMLGAVQANAAPRALPTDALRFTFPGSLASGPAWVRLRVDGVDSVLLDRSGPAPVFDATQTVGVPA